MNTDNGSLSFDAIIDNSNFKRQIDEMTNKIKGLSDTTVNQGKKMETSFAGIGSALAAIGGTAFLGMLANKIINVTGEFQQLDVAFTTMLGSKEKADKLMAQIVETAAKTPFTLTEVAQGAKQLLAYQVAAEDVNETVIRLGNIASGVSVPLSRLILVYGQVKAKGKLMGDDLRQFTEAGLPIINELAKSMGVADSEISKMVENGKIGFPEVQKVIQNLTNEGGMFFNLMQKQSLTVTGQISNLKDSFDRMLNSIGEENSGIISDGISGLTALTENYEKIGKVILGLVAMYGTYKAAIIVTNAVQASQVAINELVIASGGLINVKEATSILIKEKLTVATLKQTAAQLGLNVAVLSNPYVLATMAIVALGAAMWALHDNTTEAERAQEALNNRIEDQKSISEDARGEVEKNISIIKDEVSTVYEKYTALKNLQTLYPSIFKGLDAEQVKNMKLADVLKLVNIELEKKNALSDKQDLAKINKLLSSTKGGASFSEMSQEREILGDKASWYMPQDVLRKKLEAEKEAILTKQKNEAEARKIAAFEKLTNTQKIDYLKQQNKELEKQSQLASGIGFFSEPIVKGYKNQIVKNNNEIANYSKPAPKKAETDEERKAREKSEKKAKSDFDKAEKEAERLRETFEKNKIDAKKRAFDADIELQRSAIENNIKVINDGLNKEGISYQKEQELLQQRTDAKKDLIDFDLKQTLKGIDDQEAAYKESAKNAGVKNPDLSSFTSMRTTANTKSDNEKKAVDVFDIEAEKGRLNALLSKFQDIKQQMLTLESNYNNDIETLNKALLNAKTDAEKVQVQNSIAERTKEFEKTKSSLSVDELMQSPDWTKLFGNLDNVTTRELIKLKDKVEAEFNNMNLDPKDLEALRNKIGEITSEIEQRNPFLALSEAIKKYKNDQSSVNFKDVMKDVGASLDAIQGIFDQVTGSLDKLGIKTTDQDKQVLADVSGMIGGAADVAKGIATGNPLDIIKGSIALITNGIDLIAGAKDRKLEKSIARHKAEVDRLKLAYEDLERAIDKALGSDRYSAQKATIDNLKKQQQEYLQMAADERAKKKGDEGKAQEYEKAASDSINAVADTINKMREEILQMDVSSAAKDLGGAIIDAFTAGEDAAAAWGKKVDGIVGDVIRKMLVQKLVEQPVGNIINKYMAQWVDGEGNFLGFDAVMNSAVQMGNELTAIGPGLSSALEALPEDIKKYITGDSAAGSNKTALSGAVKSVSEDTAGIISGQMNAMRINQIESISIIRQQLLSLNQIAINTENLNGILSAMNTLVNGGRAQGLW